jgi:hypothetical protein
MTPAERLELVRGELASFLPHRVVTRDLKDFADRPEKELRCGVFTIVASGEDSLQNYRGGEASFGRMRIVVVGQIHLGERTTGSQVEDAELALVEELKRFTRLALVEGIDSFIINNWQQSGQIEVPYGWILAEMELRQ